ncbi:endo-1,4-beta-xylanase [Paenibacillus sp. BK720]|uniref:endo-1,4-beta-xylanase n=1 Tax=Paenibacillus sp. BK720 TaxID=2587092 RepID=UPI001ABBCD68|nr:endo-1,4-beta-xylanase [Paenibacillus sp. BK720]NIK68107.1 endo-1,4-beta-xylanase [Paenibacillus sp. BK720]
MLRIRNKAFFTIILSAVLLVVVIMMLILNKSGEPGQTTAANVQTTALPVSAAPQEPSESSTEPPKQTAEAVAPSVQLDIPSLAETFENDFAIGAALEPNQTNGLSAELLKKQVNMLVAENAMKPASIQPAEGQFNWDQADRIVAFAKANHMAIRFHTLVWHSQVPDWFFRDADGKPMADETDAKKREANKKLLLDRLDAHIRAIVGRYKDDIKYWDVVNEVIEPADPDGMRSSNWYNITGTDYIATAFRAAREAGGPGIKLYINDYGTDDPRKRDRLYDLVKEMLDKGVPIDGVGHQTHISIYSPSVMNIMDSMKKFKELGLDNQITELDMSVYNWNDRTDYGAAVPEHILQKQAQRYKELFEALKSNAGLVSAVVFWGIADDHTWLSTFPVARTEAPLLFDKQLHAKPAFWAIVGGSNADR